ncbi:T9SS type A sorting domain-containing protein [Fluviicola sp.]|uniref:T9SS type A sorting domain-containing protein n=1 Tax=Fluviicola sp. TaxID=1917219 RepID=UPI0031D1C7F6
MKKSYHPSLFVLFLLLFTGISHAQTYSGGAGTILDPYQIATKSDLQYLSEHENHWDKYFLQTADIYFNSSDFQTGGNFYNNGEGFKTLGNEFTAFLGSYDANGHLIDSLYINRPTVDYQGFFGRKVWGSIRGLGLTHIFVKGQSYNGGLVGRFDDGDIVDCYTTGTVYGNIIFTGSDLNFTGGLTGYHTNGIIARCHSTADVDGNIVGGLIGLIENSTVNDCYATGNVFGNNGSYVGGLIGLIGFGPTSVDAIVKDCFASGNVSGNYAVGGLIGNSDGTISNCFASGSVSGNYSGGGLIGFTASTGTVINCYATGSVTGIQFLGGLIGYNSGDLKNCHAVGNVTSSTGNDTIGGLCGGNEGTILHSFWDMQASGVTHSFGGAGLPTSAMKDIQTFIGAGWDFELETSNGSNDIWKMGGCSFDYPVFSWQQIVPHPTATSYEFACGSYTWAVTGLNYPGTGIYLGTVSTPSGCDSLLVLNLTVGVIPSDFVFNNGDGNFIASFGTSYQWIDCFTNAYIPGATGQFFAPSSNGFYSVLITNNGCSITSDCLEMTNLGIPDWSDEAFTVFPNPAQNKVTISLPVNSASLSITDTQGKVLFAGQITADQQISLDSFENGVYFFAIETETGKVLKRVVKN